MQERAASPSDKLRWVELALFWTPGITAALANGAVTRNLVCRGTSLHLRVEHTSYIILHANASQYKFRVQGLVFRV